MRASHAVVLVLLGLLVGCADQTGTGATGTATSVGTTEAGEQPSARRQPTATQPDICLMRGGAFDVEHPEPNFWRGTTDAGLLLRIERFASPGKAREAVDAATDIDAKAVRRYAVLGPVKGRATDDVDTVADCLLNG